ncbi:TIR domain-containing protein [Tepidamorphus sp. 3E244]|uniref:nSTAND1 domain-containing NTPase n=1 Tax=Tepidamorphus sp. 3E244 TaxID=3385498 RepID=UPI0038FD200F
MARIFISHSSANNAEALAITQWLGAQGWNDVFLDIDPDRGLIAGERWQNALKSAAARCEVVVFLLSPAWVNSRWCLAEFLLAKQMNKRILGVLVEEVDIASLPVEMTAEYQLVDLAEQGDQDTFEVEVDRKPVAVAFNVDGLARLKHGLRVSGVDAGYFHWPPEDDPQRAPYPGLRPLDVEDAGIFFGRDGQIITGLDLVRRLRDAGAPRLLVILGASGSGKSSFMRAGLLPRLSRDDRHFTVLPPIRPDRGALHGETGLVTCLCDAFAMAQKPRNRASIRKAVDAGADAVRALLGELADLENRAGFDRGDESFRHAVIMPVDQGEALFSAEAREEAETFLALFRELLSGDAPAVIGMVTIRSDNYEYLQTAAALEGVNAELLSLPPMPGGAYGEVIHGPARRLTQSGRQLKLDDTLVEALLSDIEKGGSKDALPLLAFTLERLYNDYGDDGDLTLAEYNELGGIRGSINAAVERALARADATGAIPADRTARLNLLRRGLIPWLAGIDPDTGTPRRRVARLSEIPAEARPLMDLLVEERLLATDVDLDTRETTIEPAHEALLRQWGRLEGWLEEDLRELSAIEGVRRASRDWAANGKNPQWLAHVAGRLEDAEAAAAREDLRDLLQPTDLEYLARAREAEDARVKAEINALRRQRMLAMVAGAIFAVATVVAGVLWMQASAARQAEEQARIAEEDARKQEEAQRIIAQASEKIARSRLSLAEGNVEQAVTLSLESLDLHETEQGRSAALTALMELSPNLRALVRGGGARGMWLDWSGENLSVARRGGSVTGFSPAGETLAENDLSVGGGDGPEWLMDPVLVKTAEDGSLVAVLTSGEILRIDASGSISSVAAPSNSAPLYSGPHRIAVDDAATVFAMARTDRSVLLRRCDLAAARPACRDSVVETIEAEALALSRDGARLAVAGSDGAIVLHSAGTGERIGETLGDKPGPLSIAFSSDASLLAVGTRGGELTVYDAAALSPSNGAAILATNRVSGSAITALRFAPDAPMLALVCDEQDICLYPLETFGEETLSDPAVRLTGHRGAIAGMSWHAGGDQLATIAVDSDLRVWAMDEDVRVRHDLAPSSWQPLVSIAADPQSGRIVAGNDAGGIYVWDGDGIEPPVSVASTGAPDPVSSVALGPDGMIAAVHERLGVASGPAGGDAPLQMRLVPGNRVARVVLGADGTAIAVPAQANALALVAAGADNATLTDGPSSMGEPFGLTLHPDGTKIFTSQTDGSLLEWPLGGGEPRVVAEAAASGPDAIGGGSVSVSPDGRWLTASNASAITIHPLVAGQEPVRLEFEPGDEDVKVVAFSPDGSRLAVLMSDAKLYVWDWADTETVRFATTQAVPQRSLAGMKGSRRRAASWLAWRDADTLAIATAAGRVQLLKLDQTAWRARAGDLAVVDYTAE